MNKQILKKTYKYRLYPTKSQQEILEKQLSVCRWLYNHFLEERRNLYQKNKTKISCYDQIKKIPKLKKEKPELKEIYSQTLQDVVRRLDKSFQNFFRRVKENKNGKKQKPGFPRFKGKNRYDSFSLKQTGWKLIGCQSFLTTSKGEKIDNPRFLKHSESILTMRQQRLSRRLKGSERRNKARLLVAKIQEKISNQRKDFHFKTANKLIKENDKIHIEKLKNWKTFKGLNKSMRDVSWFQFFSILKAKAAEAGRWIVEVLAKNTSQICSRCGAEIPKDLSVRIHKCPYCSLEIDRDWNSALNILRLGASLSR